jgi:predicted GNAT family N-acyltransferase
MAVRQPGRGTGVGGAILTLLMDKARERGDAAVVLNAQTVAAPFYARHGFVQQGEVFEEAGIAHVEMRLQF